MSVRYWLWTDYGEGLSSGAGVAGVLLKAVLWRSGGAVSQYSQQLEDGVEEEAPARQRVPEQGLSVDCILPALFSMYRTTILSLH